MKNIIANLVVKIKNILTLLNFLIKTLQNDMTKTPNPVIAMLKNGLKQLATFSFKQTSILSTSSISSIYNFPRKSLPDHQTRIFVIGIKINTKTILVLSIRQCVVSLIYVIDTSSKYAWLTRLNFKT